jgi:hypothetical protein
MTIFGPILNSPVVEPLFDIYFVHDLTAFEIYFVLPEKHPGIDIRVMCRPEFRLQLLPRSKDPDYFAVLGFPHSEAVSDRAMALKKNYTLPFRRLRARLAYCLRKASSNSQSLMNLRLVISPDAVITWAIEDRNREARKHLSRFLATFTGGSVQILYSETPGTPMLELGNGQFLFGFTLVFPWALAALALGPNCLETDTTYYCIRPYTMANLHAIFANTSLPIAMGISPSETAGSYIRIYEHIHGLMQRYHPELMDGPLQAVNLGDDIPDDGPVKVMGSFPKGGIFAQAGEAPVPGAGDVEERAFHEEPEQPPAHPQAPVPDTGDVEEEDVNEEPDGPLPSADPVTPPDEEEDSIEEVIRSLEETGPPEKRSALTCLAILTDMGKALAAFVKYFHLDWKLCIRHILQAIGTKDPIFSWVLRLIYCWSAAEYVHACATIRLELEALDYVPAKIGILRAMMGEADIPHPINSLSRWAAFARSFGIPRPSNHIEGRHHWLNLGSEGLTDLIDLVLQVCRYFMAAYEKRNENLIATLKRNYDLVFPSEEAQAKPSFNPAKWKYYRELHTLVSRSDTGPSLEARIEPDCEKFAFPREGSSVKVEYALPAKWRPKRTVVDTAQVPQKQTLHAKGTRTAREWLGWQIYAELRREHSHQEWDKHSTTLFAQIFALGTSTLVNSPALTDDGPFSAQQDANWRIAARKCVKTELNLVATPRAQSAKPKPSK